FLRDRPSCAWATVPTRFGTASGPADWVPSSSWCLPCGGVNIRSDIMPAVLVLRLLAVYVCTAALLVGLVHRLVRSMRILPALLLVLGLLCFAGRAMLTAGVYAPVSISQMPGRLFISGTYPIAAPRVSNDRIPRVESQPSSDWRPRNPGSRP